jgi:hypothetical protein
MKIFITSWNDFREGRECKSPMEMDGLERRKCQGSLRAASSGKLGHFSPERSYTT